MNGIIPISVVISIFWAITSLLVQWYIVWGGGRHDFSQRSGEPVKGMIYNFTVAMMPSHKETVRLHPVKFMAGIIMHCGAFLAMAITVWLLMAGALPASITRPLIALLGISLIAAVFLLIRRLTSPVLKSMSSPDDIFAIIITTSYIAMVLLLCFGLVTKTVYLLFSTLFFLYLPLGKLRHALFFFVSRGDYGRRLGYRGVYPVANSPEQDTTP